MRIPVLLLASLMIVSCGNEKAAKQSAAPIADSDTDISIRATSDLDTLEPIKSVTFVPNSVATWLSHIILLTQDGKLLRTNAQSDEPMEIGSGEFKDIFGLAREAQPGVFLAITADDTIRAFVEKDDDGNFKTIPVSGGVKALKFCADSTPQDRFVWVLTVDGDLQKLNISVQDNALVEIKTETAVQLPFPIKTCSVTSDDTLQILSQGKTANLDGSKWQDSAYPASAVNLVNLPGALATISHQDGGSIILDQNGDSTTLTIADGLSIRGIKNPTYATVTNANLGSAFSDGVLIAVDSKSNRLVMIARDYMMRKLEEKAN